MGLDQYIFRIKKLELSDRLYTTEDISKIGLNRVSVNG